MNNPYLGYIGHTTDGECETPYNKAPLVVEKIRLVKLIDDPPPSSLNVVHAFLYHSGVAWTYTEHVPGHYKTVTDCAYDSYMGYHCWDVEVYVPPEDIIKDEYREVHRSFGHVPIIISSAPTCTTPGDQLVEIPTVNVNDFAGVDTVGGVKPFWLQFTNCSNHSAIRYKVDAVGTSPNASLGLLPSTPNMTVAVQVKHTPTGYTPVPVQLGNWYQINTSASSHNLPMSVNYYKVGNVLPGAVNAQMKITVEYQ